MKFCSSPALDASRPSAALNPRDRPGPPSRVCDFRRGWARRSPSLRLLGGRPAESAVLGAGPIAVLDAGLLQRRDRRWRLAAPIRERDRRAIGGVVRHPAPASFLAMRAVAHHIGRNPCGHARGAVRSLQGHSIVRRGPAGSAVANVELNRLEDGGFRA